MTRLLTAKKPRWQVAAATDVGMRRALNEDSYAVLNTTQLRAVYDFALIVADGMGGRNAGEVASRTAVEAASQAILNNLRHVDASALLRFAVEAAHISILQRAEGNPEYEGMGTTLLIALVKENRLWVASVGDSRAYILRGERLIPLTADHTFVAEQLRAGGITSEQARHSRFRHMLTRAVGTNVDYTPDIASAETRSGDVLMLCTDGLTSMVWEEEIVRLLRKYRYDPERACRNLIEAANEQGGQDNITVLLAVDMRNGVAQYDGENEELQTVSELPTARDPLYRIVRAAQQLSLRRRVLSAVVLVAIIIVAGVLWRISSAKQPRPMPQLPSPPPVVDLSSVRYTEPQVLLNKPLRGAPLIVSPDGNLYAMSEQGRVLRISPEGKILTVSDAPFEAAANPEVKPDMVYFATDAQGNLYVCDRSARRILKYRPEGTLIGNIGEGRLKRPAALAVGSDGSVYVIDAGRLTVFRALSEIAKDGTQPHR
ncbi:MAG: Stp1/IreP family PP2C-type Ser/Thr phosphatase [Armatimonadota bacterium]|nr:Stp1/IreP family PP2C-type Ser/Thr phosphatase [bacterium]MDW8320993.1 Stp1/IreP family PP2C-type Ser/Thr phosphatase [Armatimonadota bacterium]